MPHVRVLSTMLVASTLLPFTGCADAWRAEVVREVLVAEAQLAAADGSSDPGARQDLLSIDYVLVDASGTRSTREELRARRLAEEWRGAAAEVTALEVVPITRDAALTRGRRTTRSLVYGGLPRTETVWSTSLWQRRRETWRLMSDQMTGIDPPPAIRLRASIEDADLDRAVGTFELDLSPALRVTVERDGRDLRLRIPGQLDEGVRLIPDGPRSFVAVDEPWRLVVPDGDRILLTTWADETSGRRMR